MDTEVDLDLYAKDDQGLFFVMDFSTGNLLHLTKEEIIQWRKDYL